MRSSWWRLRRNVPAPPFLPWCALSEQQPAGPWPGRSARHWWCICLGPGGRISPVGHRPVSPWVETACLVLNLYLQQGKREINHTINWASSWDYGTYHRRPSKAQASIRAVSPEPSLFAHMKYGSWRRVRPKIRHLALLDGCACVFKEWVYGGQKVPWSHELAQLMILSFQTERSGQTVLTQIKLEAVWPGSTLFAILSASFGSVTVLSKHSAHILG